MNLLDKYIVQRIIVKDPIQRLQTIWQEVASEVQNESNWARPIGDTKVPKLLNQVVDILVKDAAAVTDTGIQPGATEFFLNNEMLVAFLSLSETDVPTGFRAEVVRFTSSIVSLLDPKIIFQSAIHRPILFLFQNALGYRSIDFDVIELALNAASKIKDYPDLIHVFFQFRSTETERDLVECSPLLALLLKALVNQDQAGDFARAAFLIIVDIMSNEVEELILSSDFVQLVMDCLLDSYANLPSSVASFDEIKDSETQRSVACLTKWVSFLQDILGNAPNSKLSQKLLNDFSSIILDETLYRHLIGSSDLDGTATANIYRVLSLSKMVVDPSLADILVKFIISASRSTDDEETPLVREFLLSKINSLSEDVAIMSLKTFSSILLHHNSLTIPLLIGSLNDFSDSCLVPLDLHTKCMDRYLALLSSSWSIDANEVLESRTFADVQNVFAFLKRGSSSKSFEMLEQKPPLNEEQLVERVKSVSTDPFFEMLLTLFNGFFDHSFNYNLQFTEMLSLTLSSPCPFIYLSISNSDLILNDPSHVSLYTIFSQHFDLIEQKKKEIPDFEAQIKRVYESLASYEGSGEKKKKYIYSIVDDGDSDAEFYRNVVLLNEFLQEVNAIHLSHGLESYHGISVM